MPAKGLTRRITRKEAKSYEVSSPNPLGVTAIAAVMNSGAYEKRYKQTRKLLAGGHMHRLKGAAFKKSAQYKKMMAGLRRHKARRNGPASDLNALFDAQTAPKKKKRHSAPAADFDRGSVAAHYAASQRAGFGTPAARARGGKGKGKRKPLSKQQRAHRARERTTRQLGQKYGRYKPVSATIGGRRVPTYATAGRGGKTKKIPLWAIVGAKSQKEIDQRPIADARIARRVHAAEKRRAQRAKSLLAHGDTFTPNRRRGSRRRAVSYATWSKSMHRARKNRRKGKKMSEETKRLLAANKKKGRRAAGKRKGRKYVTRTTRTSRTFTRASKRHKGRRTKVKHTKRTTRRFRRNPATVTATTPNRRGRKGRRSAAQKRATARMIAGNKRGRGKRKAKRNMMYSENRRRRTRRNNVRNHAGPKRVYATDGKMYAANRRRRAKRNMMYSANKRRRHYRRNPDVMAQLKSTFKTAAVVAVGFVAHRAGSYLVSEKLLTKIEALNTGSASEWRGTIGGALVALVGIPLASYAAPRQAAQIGAGMAVSFLHQLLVTVLKKAGQPEVAGYMAGYPDNDGAAYHSMSGYGSYEMMPQAGYGAYEMSGYGAFTQAAAGMGQPVFQAAAGFGQPILQAAAGMGEYVATGAQGIGEYEAVNGYGAAPQYVDEGIHPNLQSAERALTIAEAAAGIGDMPMQSILTPDMIAAPVLDAPAGSRAGILYGEDGVFTH